MSRRILVTRLLLLLALFALPSLACDVSVNLNSAGVSSPTPGGEEDTPVPPTATSVAVKPPATTVSLPTATSVRGGGIISSAVMARESTPITLGPKSLTDTFPANHKVYHAVVTVKDAPSNTPVKVVWSATDVGTAPVPQLGDYTLTANGSENLDFTYTTGSQGLPPGKYKVDVYVSDKFDRTLTFTVVAVGGRLPPTPTARPAGKCPPPPPPNYKPPLLATKITMAEGTQGGNLDPVNPTRIFGPDSVFYAVVRVDEAPANTKVTAVWYVQDVGDAEPCNTLITKSEVTTSGSRNLSFSLRPRTKWPVGTYRVEIYVGGPLSVEGNLNIDTDFKVQ